MDRMDARLREMQFLAQLDREGTREYQEKYAGTADQQMIASLLENGYLNDFYDHAAKVHPDGVFHALAARPDFITNLVGMLIIGQPVTLRIGHRGRVRLSELEQQLKTGRDRDETGLLWAKRHIETDLAIALLSASTEASLSVVFLDMNGLKAINDTYGHSGGDEAIRAFFQAVMSTLGQHGEAYRNGGDEAVVILPRTTDDGAGRLLGAFVRQLGKEVLRLGESRVEVALTASCGSVSTTNPAGNAKALLKRADEVQYRAKNKSKEQSPRVSAIAVGETEVTTYAPVV
ncbi:diguanylate cyclase [Sorangium sp. So ce367]|uniref:diguanylate cyclase domain-containing protein n=1 Tax=Sorangium sp. So ce367 TaxID=3133305 RepID=UPI003F5DE843